LIFYKNKQSSGFFKKKLFWGIFYFYWLFTGFFHTLIFLLSGFFIFSKIQKFKFFLKNQLYFL